MTDPWVTIAEHDDLMDAEWAAALLVEADIPAVVHDPGAGPLQVRVEPEHADRARQLLAEDQQADNDPADEVTAGQGDGPELPNGVFYTSERRRLAVKSLGVAFFACCFPPAALYAVWLAFRAAIQPEPMDLTDWFEVGRPLIVIAVGGMFWFTYLAR